MTAAPSRVLVDGALDGRVAVVTGGGTNLGKAAAAELVRSGASVVIVGRRDLVLNNAGGHMVPAESLATKGWRAVQRLNVEGTLAMCQGAYELAMRDADAGTIIK